MANIERGKTMDWLQRFMYGRHGVDQLNLVMMLAAIFITIVENFVRGPVFFILFAVAVLLFVLVVYRMFSRNEEKRRQENQKFLTAVQPVVRWFSTMRSRWRDRKVCRYYRCPHCKATLRVPRGKGKIQIKCPVCKTEFIRKT